ncbi:hypothetical protein D3C84_654090 [compost metagenome]
MEHCGSRLTPTSRNYSRPRRTSAKTRTSCLHPWITRCPLPFSLACVDAGCLCCAWRLWSSACLWVAARSSTRNASCCSASNRARRVGIAACRRMFRRSTSSLPVSRPGRTCTPGGGRPRAKMRRRFSICTVCAGTSPARRSASSSYAPWAIRYWRLTTGVSARAKAICRRKPVSTRMRGRRGSVSR